MQGRQARSPIQAHSLRAYPFPGFHNFGQLRTQGGVSDTQANIRKRDMRLLRRGNRAATGRAPPERRSLRSSRQNEQNKWQHATCDRCNRPNKPTAVAVRADTIFPDWLVISLVIGCISYCQFGYPQQDGIQHIEPHHDQYEPAGNLEAAPVAREAL